MITPYTCPDCSSPLDLQEDAETETPVFRVQTVGIVEMVRRTAIVAFCTGCEFAIEIRPEVRS